MLAYVHGGDLGSPERGGRGFAYRNADGKPVRDPETPAGSRR
jgi:hypothetical protein